MRKMLLGILIVGFLLFGCFEPTVTQKDLLNCNKGSYASGADNFASGPKVSLIEISGWGPESTDPSDPTQECRVKFTYQDTQTILGTTVHGQVCTFYRTSSSENLAQEGATIDTLLNSCNPW